MPDDGTDEEPVVCHFHALLYPGSTQVKVHLVVGAGHGGQVEIAHPAELQLEGQGGLQVTVNAIFCKLQADRHRHPPSLTPGPRACWVHTVSCRLWGCRYGTTKLTASMLSNCERPPGLKRPGTPQRPRGHEHLVCRLPEGAGLLGSSARSQHLPGSSLSQYSLSQEVTDPWFPYENWSSKKSS